MTTFEQHITEYQAWLDDRPTLKELNQDIKHLTYLLYLEMLELMDAVADENNEEIPKELADVFNFCLSMAFLNGYDLLGEASKKIERNKEKYPKELFQNGDPKGAYTQSREVWDASR